VEEREQPRSSTSITAKLGAWWAQPGNRALVFLLGLLAAMAYFKFDHAGHTFTTNIDGGYYTNIAKHVRDGDGLTTDVSLYHKAYAYFPHPTSVYPLWPLVYGFLGRFAPLAEVGRWAPTCFYFVALVGAFRWARRVWPEDFFARLPGFGAGHALVLIFGLNLNFFRFTSFPYTEGLGYALLFAALFRFASLWREPSWRAGAEMGLWLGLCVLARAQFIILAIACASVLGFALVVGHQRRRHAIMALCAIAGFSLLLIPYLAWVSSFIPDAGIGTMLRFDQARPNDLLEPVEAYKPAESISAFLWDRASGIPVAFGFHHRYAYQRTFHGFQYAIPLALPFLLASAIDATRRRPVLETLRSLTEGESLNRLFIVVFALGGFVSIHLVHKIAWAEWNFAKRQALTCSFMFFLCLLYLLRHKRSLPFLLGVFLLCAGTFRAGEAIATTTSDLVERSKGPRVYKKKLVEWLHSVRGDAESLVVATPPGKTQRLSVYTEGIHYHWINQRTSLEELERLVDQRGVQFVVVPKKRAVAWAMFEDEKAFKERFVRVAKSVSGMRIYEPRKYEEAVAALAALAHESRLAAYRALVGAGPDGLHAGEVAARLGTPSSTLSFHLKHLSAAGLVSCEREGRALRYRADFDRVAALTGYLTDHCCGGDPAACLPDSDALEDKERTSQETKP
jgi:DNA-binding transcriptional ArsR family regulator